MKQPIAVIIDDEQPVLDVMRVKIEAAGFDVHVADSGDDGWALIESLKPDVAIIDYLMPGLNGVEVCKKMLDEPATAQIPVIAISSKWDTIGPDMENMANVVEFVRKPFSPRKLVTLVRRLANVPASPAQD